MMGMNAFMFVVNNILARQFAKTKEFVKCKSKRRSELGRLSIMSLPTTTLVLILREILVKS